jgi:hypothetical protein
MVLSQLWSHCCRHGCPERTGTSRGGGPQCIASRRDCAGVPFGRAIRVAPLSRIDVRVVIANGLCRDWKRIGLRNCLGGLPGRLAAPDGDLTMLGPGCGPSPRATLQGLRGQQFANIWRELCVRTVLARPMVPCRYWKCGTSLVVTVWELFGTNRGGVPP